MQIEHTPYRQFALAPHISVNLLTALLRNLHILHEDDKGKGRSDSMQMFVERLNHLPESEQLDWIKRFNEVAFQSVDAKVSMLGISYFDKTQTVFSKPISDFLDGQGYEDLNEFEMNNFFGFEPTSTLRTVYRHAETADDRITSVTFVFGKEYQALNVKSDPLRCAFVVLNLNLATGEAKFNLPYAYGQIQKPESSVIPTQLFQSICERLLRDGIQFRLDNTRQLIFSLYKGITTSNEQKYLNQIESSLVQDDFINDFYHESLNKLALTVADDRIDFCSRLKSLYLRLLISKDFTEFKEFVEKSNYSVQGFLFKDPDGSVVNGKNGFGYRVNVPHDQLPPMESSNVYFDSRDSIYQAESLFQLVVQDAKRQLPCLTRYQGFPNLVLIHFLSKKVGKDVAESVFQDFINLTHSV